MNYNNHMKITIGALAHVDAGKTSLAEAILYKTGELKQKGNIDNGNTFLDYNPLEKQKGITIINKETSFSYKNHDYYYIDTPGHIDLSYEANKAINILDVAILIVSSIEDIPIDTIKRFNHLQTLNIPILIFINKMDISRISKEEILNKLKNKLDENCINYKDTEEYLSLVNDDLLDEYLKTNHINIQSIKNHLRNQDFYPCFFGSALKDEGIEELLDYLNEYINNETETNELNAYIYKVINEYSYIKVLSGTLLNKTSFNDYKVNEIYDVKGENYKAISKLEAGDIGAIKGLKGLKVGTYLPSMNEDIQNTIPSLTYRIISNFDSNELYKKIQVLNNEDRNLYIHIENRQVYINLNGEIHQLVIKNLIKERFNIDISFSFPIIKYKETIKDIVYGVGHFEPLRHYAEVIVKLEPNENGYKVSSLIENNYTNSLLSYLNTYIPKGILTNSPLTNIKITIVDIKTHLKHTEGQDLIESLKRAIRQALTQINSILLEPYYITSIDTDDNNQNMIISYITQNKYSYSISENKIITSIPIAFYNDFITNLKSKLKGNLSFSIEKTILDNCLKQEEVIKEKGYDYHKDFHNPAGSVFCFNGAGHYVEPEDVILNMHLNLADYTDKVSTSFKYTKTRINEDELKRVWDNLYKPKPRYINKTTHIEEREYKPKPVKPLIYLIDGYNLMYQLNEELAYEDLFNARVKTIDLVLDFSGYVDSSIVLVFDAYKNDNPKSVVENHGNIDIVYTKKDLLADTYIEKKSKELKDDYKVIVVTSDALEQLTVYSNNASVISSREFLERYENLKKSYLKNDSPIKNRPLENLRELLEED